MHLTKLDNDTLLKNYFDALLLGVMEDDKSSRDMSEWDEKISRATRSLYAPVDTIARHKAVLKADIISGELSLHARYRYFFSLLSATQKLPSCYLKKVMLSRCLSLLVGV